MALYLFALTSCRLWLSHTSVRQAGGSLTHYDQAQQNFVTRVALFSHQPGIVQAVMPMEHKLVSEQEVVRLLLSAVELIGVEVTLDALHTQKNAAPNC